MKIYQLVLKLSTKNQFPVAIWTFYDKPEVDFSNPYFVTNHDYRTWKCSIRILKIYQLVFKLSAKTRFSASILKFDDQTGSRIFELIIFTNHYHRSWKFAIRILKISQLVLKLLAKNRFSAAILNFYDQTGCRFFEPIYFTNYYYQSWNLANRILKISQLVLKLLVENRFSAAILNFNNQTGSRFFDPIFFY